MASEKNRVEEDAIEVSQDLTLFGNIKGITPLVEMLNFWLSILNLEIERDGGKSVLRDKG